MCDTMWAGQDGPPGTDQGGLGLSQSEMLRLDADVLLVQLNIRKLMDVRSGGSMLPALPVICRICLRSAGHTDWAAWD